MSGSSSAGGGRSLSGECAESEGGQISDDEGLLEQILLSAEQATAVEAALQAVARRFVGQPFSHDPVLRGLVECQLEPLRAVAGASFEAMCVAVSDAIYDDTAARQRAERLWQDLGGGPGHAA